MGASPMPMSSRQEVETVSRSWWIVLVNGIVSVIAGILILTIPWTLQTLAYFIGAVLVIRGIFQAFSPPHAGGPRGWNITVGIISALVGLAIIVYPSFAAFTLLTLAFFVGIWLIGSGVAAIAGSAANRQAASYWWLSLVGGILSVILGMVALFRPILTLAVAVFVFGIWAIVVGAVEIGLSFQIRRLPEALQEEEMRARRIA